MAACVHVPRAERLCFAPLLFGHLLWVLRDSLCQVGSAPLAGEQITNGFGKRCDEDIIAFSMIFVWRLVRFVKPLTTIRRILLFGFAPEVRCLAFLFFGPRLVGDRLDLAAIAQVRPACVFFGAPFSALFYGNSAQISSRGNDTMDDPDAMYPGFTETGLTSAEIQSLLDEYECPGRTVKGIHDTIEAGQAVGDYFYFGPKGPDGLMPEVFERYVYVDNMFRKNPRWWIENCATCGAPDNVYMGQEVHLYGLTRKQIECFVRCGTPRPPDFILRMDDDEFDMVGLRDTIQTSRLGAWEIQNASSG